MVKDLWYTYLSIFNLSDAADTHRGSCKVGPIMKCGGSYKIPMGVKALYLFELETHFAALSHLSFILLSAIRLRKI